MDEMIKVIFLNLGKVEQCYFMIIIIKAKTKTRHTCVRIPKILLGGGSISVLISRPKQMKIILFLILKKLNDCTLKKKFFLNFTANGCYYG